MGARLGLIGCGLLLGCRAPAPGAPAPSRASGASTPAPADDAGALCADVGSLRVCWDDADASPGGVRSVGPRPLPAAPARSPMGWRCLGRAAARACVDRAAGAPPFSCAGARCTQRHARRPDDGEWTCAPMAGAVVCAGGERAAGVAPGPADPGWSCGPRHGQSPGDPVGPRVCVDLAPDFPDGDMTGWRCQEAARAAGDAPSGARVCQRAAAPSLTAACARLHPCVDGALCVSGRCVPARPAPSCWLDSDCAGGACRFGSCRSERTP